MSAAQKIAKTRVWVQLTTGGKPYPPTLQEMFLDPMFFGMEIWPIDQPASFAALLPAPPAPTPARGVPPTQGRGAVGGGTERDEPPDYPWEPSGGRPHPGYDVLVLNDQMEWPEATRNLARQAAEAGKGFVLLHHSLGDNQDWPWWYQEVTGGLLVLSDSSGMKRSTVATAATLDVRPAGKHPILRHTRPFTLTNEETFKGMWQSPKITPLLQTSNAGSDSTIAWVGVHPTARVVCIQPGTSRETHRNNSYRMLIRNSILWAAGRL
jgi:trehalose utilization protein